MIIVDARGLSCPEPIVLTKKAINKGEKEIRVLLDSKVSTENVCSFSKTMGYKVKFSEENNEFILDLEK